MKVLLDENMTKKVKLDFGPEYQVQTTQELGWGGKSNGELFRLLTLNDFEAFITADKNLKHQQNIKNFSVTVFVLDAKDNRHGTIQPLIEKVKSHLSKDIKLEIIEIK